MDDAQLERQYDALIERSGLTIPEDRRATMMDTYKNVVTWSDMVRNRPRPAALEPSNVYGLETISRVASPVTESE
jgi:hypothetical protein